MWAPSFYYWLQKQGATTVTPADTIHSVAIAEMIALAQMPSIAQSAGVLAATWASTTNPRVLPGNKKGYLFGLHRGRLPMIEIWQNSDVRENTSWHNSWATTGWTIRVRVGGVHQDQADSQARLIIDSFFSALRQNLRQKWGEERTGELQPGVLGHMLEATFTVINRFSIDSFDVTTGGMLFEDGSGMLFEDGTPMLFEDAAYPSVIAD